MSEALRRPLHSPALGIPDLSPSFARAKAVQQLVGNKKWVSAAPIALTNAFQVVATISMTALVTGRFRVRAAGVVETQLAAATVQLGVSHGTGIIVPNYAQDSVIIPASGNEVFTGAGTVALIVDFASLGTPFVAALGSTTALNLLMLTSGGSAALGTNGVTFEAEEF